MFDYENKPDNFLADTQQPADTPSAEPQKPTMRRRIRRILIWIGLIAIAVVALIIRIHYFNPHETDIEERGYVIDIKRQGVIFKTWEGEMVLESSSADPSVPYQRNFTFSVDNEKVAAALNEAKLQRRPVTVGYCRYQGAVPWRGASTVIVNEVK